MPKTTTSKPASLKKPLTPAERQAAADVRATKKATEKLEREMEEKKRHDEFEANKDIVWLRLWARALQMSILINKETLLESEAGSFWIGSFEVNATPGYESIEHDVMHNAVTLETFSLDNVDQLTQMIDGAFEERTRELERRENQRLEAERIARVRKNALEKLSVEERQALNLH